MIIISNFKEEGGVNEFEARGWEDIVPIDDMYKDANMGDVRDIYWINIIDDIIDENNKEDKHERKWDICEK